LAREGKEIERKARKITVYDISIRRFILPCQVEVDVDCSKGTYIRTLCADIGKALGCGGHMASLLRTASGAFSLENAIKLGELKAFAEAGRLEEVLLGLEDALMGFGKVFVSEKSTKLLYNGGKIRNEFFQAQRNLEVGQTVTVFDHEANLMGLYKVVQEENSFFIKPFKMLI
jgi:tRNA pseudouridine55 synthase